MKAPIHQIVNKPIGVGLLLQPLTNKYYYSQLASAFFVFDFHSNFHFDS